MVARFRAVDLKNAGFSVQELKEVKAAYKQAHGEMRAANEAMVHAAATVDEARAELLKQFDSWYTLSFADESSTLAATAPAPDIAGMRGTSAPALP